VLFSFNFELQQFLGPTEALLWSTKPEPRWPVPLVLTARTVATSAKCRLRPVAGQEPISMQQSDHSGGENAAGVGVY
jgi:hypothetical protein